MENQVRKKKVGAIDHLGRVVIPKKIRLELDLREGTPVDFVADPNQGGVLVKKKGNFCLRCGGEKDLVEIKKHFYLCRACLKSLAEKAE